MKKLRGPQKRNPNKLIELSGDQLEELWNTFYVDRVVPQNNDEAFDCHECNLPQQNKAGEYRPLRTVFLAKSKVGYQPGSVVLTCNGDFPKPNEWVSHLCDNPRCIRYEHLIWESAYINHKRKNCPGIVACRCCDEMHDACVHNPPCKKITKR